MMKWKKTGTKVTCAALLAALAITGAAAAAIPAQAADSSSTQTEADILIGGWSVNRASLSISKNADAKKAFEKATENLTGVDYVPVSLLGTQVVAGTNYCILAKATTVYPGAQAEYVLVYLYEDLDGNAEITGVYSLADEIGVDTDSNASGGWSFQQGKASVNANKTVKKAYQQAIKKAAKKNGTTYRAAAYLAKQTVSGTNYCVLCRTTDKSGKEQLRLVQIYKSLKGNAKVTEEQTLDISALSDKAN